MSVVIPINPLSLNPLGFVGSLLTSQAAHAVSGSAPSANAASAVSSASPFANLNLTSAEQAQISAILRTSQGQTFGQLASSISGVLTPAQRQTFASDLQALQSSGHHHHHHGSGGSGSASTIDSGLDAFGVSSTASGSTAATASGSLFSDIASTFSARAQTQQQSQLLEL
jgi:hypothetical protein